MNRKIIVMLCCLVVCCALLCSPRRSSQTKIPRIGYLTASSPSVNPTRVEAFRQGLRELGYVEGKNIVIEWRYAEGKLDRLPALVAELVRLNVDIIVTAGPPATRAAKEATSRFPSSWPRMRSCWQWVCRQPGATRREHYWLVHPCPRDKRKTTGAFEGDCS